MGGRNRRSGRIRKHVAQNMARHCRPERNSTLVDGAPNMNVLRSVTACTALFGSVRRGHGLKVSIKGLRASPAALINPSTLRIDIVGPVWAGQAVIVKAIAPSVLPFSLSRVDGAERLSQ